MPNACCIDPAIYQHEQNTLFRDSWVAVGFGKGIPQPGCVKPIDFAELQCCRFAIKMAILMCFKRYAVIAVSNELMLPNSCAVQLHILITWTYGSDGAALRKTPHLGGPGIHTHVSVKHCKYPLNTIRAHLWHDIIFVNIRVQRPNLMTKLRALSASGVNLNNQFIMAAQTYLSVSRLIVTGNWLSKITAIFIISHLCIRH